MIIGAKMGNYDSGINNCNIKCINIIVWTIPVLSKALYKYLLLLLLLSTEDIALHDVTP